MLVSGDGYNGQKLMIVEHALGWHNRALGWFRPDEAFTN
jgi:hypothetical protein